MSEDYQYISQNIIQCITSELGCEKYTKTENGSILFTYHNLAYLCINDINDPFYLRIILPNIDDINKTDNKFLLKLLELNAKFKVGKFVVMENSIWVVAEVILTGTTRMMQTFVDLVSLLEQMRSEYAEYVKTELNR